MSYNIRLKEHLKRMVNKATVMGWSVKQVHAGINKILKKYGVGDFLPSTVKGLKNKY